MANFYVHKVSALPAVLQADSMYIVEDTDLDFAELYFTDSSGSTARRLPTRSDIEGWDLDEERKKPFSRFAYGSTVANASDRIMMKSGGTLALQATPDEESVVLVSAENSDVNVQASGTDTVNGGSNFAVRNGETHVFVYSSGDWSNQHWGGQEESFMQYTLAP